MPVHRELRPPRRPGGAAAVRDLSPRRRPHAAGTPTLHIYGGAEDMFLNGSDRALRRVLAIGVLAFGAAVAQAGPVKPERFALLDEQQVALACVAAMNARGDQAMRNEDSTNGERLTALQQYMFARRVWMLDAKVEDALACTTGRARSNRKARLSGARSPATASLPPPRAWTRCRSTTCRACALRATTQRRRSGPATKRPPALEARGLARSRFECASARPRGTACRRGVAVRECRRLGICAH